MLDREVETAANAHLVHLERATWADREGVRGGIGSDRVDRVRRGEPDPATLPGRVAPDAVVAAALDSVLVDDRAGAPGEPLPLEERAVIIAGEEARLLALGPLRDGQARSSSLVARRALALAAERERDPLEQRGIDRRQHVGLILGRVVAAGDQPQPLALDDPRVVPRPEDIGAGALGELDERIEPKPPVAAHARVRGQTLRVALDERPHDRSAELLTQVERDVRQTEPMTRLTGSDDGIG